MKTLNLTFEDEEFSAMLIAKGAKSWKYYILHTCLGRARHNAIIKKLMEKNR